MATNIKVKKITDLKYLPADDTEDMFRNPVPGAQPEDLIIVAHHTNVNNEGGANTSVVHTQAMQLEQLVKYAGDHLDERYMSAEDGAKLKDLIEQRLREAEENMAKGNDTYSSNYFVDDTGNCPFVTSSTWDVRDGKYYKYTSEFTFKSTGSANCHLTIYRGTDSGNIGAKPSNPASHKMFAIIQIKSRSGEWKLICQQPVQNSHGGFDIELHGYFYAGTTIRGAVYTDQQPPTDANTNIKFNYSGLQVTRFSSDKGFPEHSFDWWVSNNGALESSKISPDTISAEGFLNFSGKYWHNKSSGSVGNAQADYWDKTNKKWIKHYCTDAVYAKMVRGGTTYFLGNTENDAVAQKTAGVTDGYSGKYYYISAAAAYPVSAFTATDFTFTDNVTKNYADSGGGWHNATLIKYVRYDELSIVVDGFSPEVSAYRLSDLQEEFNDSNSNTRYHRFVYEGGIGMYLSAATANAKDFTSYIGGTNVRNTAKLDLKSRDGTPCCYLRETMGSHTPGAQTTTNYSLIPTNSDGQTVHTIIRDYAAQLTEEAYWLSTPIAYTLDVLDENIEWLGVGPDVYKMTTGLGKGKTIVKGDTATDTYAKADAYLQAGISSGWALSGVQFTQASDSSPVTVRDFGFAACPRLSSVSFPANVNITGRYTFAAPSKSVQVATCNNDNGKITKSTAPQSLLTDVKFYSGDNGYTHIDGIDGDRQTIATFANCVSLKNVNMQDTDATKLGNDTFLGCASLLSVDVPNTCTEFGDNVFKNCSRLTCLILPSNVKTFGKTVFTKCPKELIDANKATAGNWKYNLSADYNITIKLSSVASDYQRGNTEINREKVWSEIRDVVNCLQAYGLGQTGASAAAPSRAGRRFFIADKGGTYLNGDVNPLTFNTICRDNKNKGDFSGENIVNYDQGPAC